MEVPLYLVDAFTSEPFRGNPAAVTVLEGEISNERMLAIAREMNQSETAFVRALPDGRWSLRWFTPKVEMDLCGHATLGTAAVLFEERGVSSEKLEFETRSGLLTVRRAKEPGRYVMDFPTQTTRPTGFDPLLLEALGVTQVESAQVAPLSFVVIEVPESVVLEEIAPEFSAMAKIKLPKEAHGVILTRRGPKPYDFTSRMFAPWIGINEDPVTGAAHTVLGPYWADKLDWSTKQKAELRAYQASPRGGEIVMRLTGARVDLEGGAVVVLRGTLLV